MRLPRIPRLGRRTPQGAVKKNGARIKFYLSALALLLVSFIVSFYLCFPANALKERIEQEVATRTPVDLQIDRLSLLFPPGLEGRDITVKTANPQLKSIGISALTVTPLWTTLFSGNPGLALRARLFGGTLGGTMRRKGAVSARMNGIAFSEPLMPNSSLKFSGILQQGTFSGAFPLRNNVATHLDLSLNQVRLTGLKPFGVAGGRLDLGNVVLVGEGRGKAFRIDKLESTGGSLKISGGGTLLILAPFDRSRLNLHATLRPGRNLDPSLRGLLNLVVKPGRDGIYHFRITGSLDRPSIR